jgi:hypothetical protein
VVGVALLVPQVHILFVCPPACGRHGAIAAIEQGCKKKNSYLCIDENEIILGGYEAEIERGVREVMRWIKPRPKALIVFMSCIDDLLGTDHDAAIRRMEEEHEIPIRLARMNPISLDKNCRRESGRKKRCMNFWMSRRRRTGASSYSVPTVPRPKIRNCPPFWVFSVSARSGTQNTAPILKVSGRYPAALPPCSSDPKEKPPRRT